MGNRISEFKRLANTRLNDSEARSDLFSKLAAQGKDRKEVDKDLKKIRDKFNKARKEHDGLSSEMAALQKKLEKSDNEMCACRKELVALNNAIQLMDLSGADGIRPEKDEEFSFLMGGNRYHVETDDVNNAVMTPWTKYRSEKKQRRLEEESLLTNNEEGEGEEGGEDGGYENDAPVDSDNQPGDFDAEPATEGNNYWATSDDGEEEDDSSPDDDMAFANDGGYWNFRSLNSDSFGSVITKVAKKRFR